MSQFLLHVFIYCVYVYMCGHMHARICGDQIQPVGVGSLLLYVKPGVETFHCLWVFINRVSARDRTYIIRL